LFLVPLTLPPVLLLPFWNGNSCSTLTTAANLFHSTPHSSGRSIYCVPHGADSNGKSLVPRARLSSANLGCPSANFGIPLTSLIVTSKPAPTRGESASVPRRILSRAFRLVS
jgi:hypothetical protein